MTRRNPRVCIIGAGPSGIVALKAIHHRGLEVDCFERRDVVGGLWNIREGEAQASYPSLECNTSKRTTQFSDFPMPAAWPPYPHNTLMAQYFNDYVDHVGVRDRIAFQTTVTRAAPSPDGGWDVTVEPGGTRHYDAVVVASGHHREPRWPDPPFPGEFAGRLMHAHDYVGPEGFLGQSVVVLGMGNSAMDIAVELSGVAGTVYLASRRGAHIVPKFAFGRPIDELNTPLPVPWPIKRAFFSAIVRRTIGRPEDVGLAPAAAVVYCTGYNISLPFLDPAVLAPADNRLDLFLHVFPPDLSGLVFVGMVQPFGSLMPVAEAQSEWVADELTGRYRLPPRTAMVAQIAAERRYRERRFVASPRHTMEIDLFPYLRAIRRERRRGTTHAAPAAAVGELSRAG